MAELRAASIAADLVGAELSNVRIAGWDALDAVYVAVRDAAWRTVPGEVQSIESTVSSDGFVATFRVRHRSDELDFVWAGRIEATPNGLIFAMDGQALTDFDANRIGFCLLHPISLKGKRVRTRTPHGDVVGRFPIAINPHQPFLDIQGMDINVADGVDLDVTFTGDLFEMEDHRNWTDAGWKTYCTPLSLPAPVRRAAGDPVRQTVELRPRVRAGLAQSGRPAGRGGAVATVGSEMMGRLPRLGLGASGLGELGIAAIAAVRSLGATYLHVELKQSGPWERMLEGSAAEALSLGLPLDIALVAEPDRIHRMVMVLAAAAVPINRISIFSPELHTTQHGTVARVRSSLAEVGLAVEVGGGSRANFAELNRGDFDLDDWDFVTYAVTPQVHHSDDPSVLRTVLALPDTANQALELARGRPLVVGPLTLRPRFNASAEVADDPDPERPGPDVDPRQQTAFAGAYLAAAAVALARADELTVFRSVGPWGLVDLNGASGPAAEAFSIVASLAAEDLLRCESSDPYVVVAAISGSSAFRLLAANLSMAPTALAVRGMNVREGRVIGGEALDPARLVLPPASVTVLTGAQETLE